MKSIRWTPNHQAKLRPMPSNNRNQKSFLKTQLWMQLAKSQLQRMITTTMEMTMTKKCQELIILAITRVSRYHRMSRICSNTFPDLNPRKLIWKQSWSHLSLITCQRLVKSMHFWKCQSQTAKKKTLVSASWMSQPWTAKTKQSWSLSTCSSRMSWDPLWPLSIRSKTLKRRAKTLLGGSITSRNYTSQDQRQPWITQNRCQTSTN